MTLQGVHLITTLSKPILGLLLLLLPFISQGQAIFKNDLADWLAAGYPAAQLDTAMNVNQLSPQACRALIERMFIIDQQTRNDLNHYGQASANYNYYNKLMGVNDRANQTLLLKILKRHGWPCQKDRSISRKAWYIAWHSRGDYGRFNQFYRHLQQARSCIDSSLYGEMKKRIEALEAIGYN
jgi:hypothetical protein